MAPTAPGTTYGRQAGSGGRGFIQQPSAGMGAATTPSCPGDSAGDKQGEKGAGQLPTMGAGTLRPGGTMQRGDKSHGEGECGRRGMPWGGGRGQGERHSHRLLPGKSSGGEVSNLLPRAMGTGRAGRGLGEKEKKEISQQEIWVKNFPREQRRRRGGGSMARGSGNRLGRRRRVAPGWGAATGSSSPFRPHFPPRPLTTKL